MSSVRDVKSVKSLEALRPNDDGTVLRAAPGLTGQVRTGVAGRMSVTFEYEYRFAGKKQYLSCGTWPKVTLATIREAKELARAMLMEGTDPATEVRNRKLAKRVEQDREAAKLIAESAEIRESMLRPTVSYLFEQWFAREVSQRKDSGAYIRRLFERDVLPLIGTLYADALTRRHLIEVLDPIKERGADRLCNVTLSAMKSMCRFGVDRELISADPSSTLTKKKHGTGRETERERFLSEDELIALEKQLPIAGLAERSKMAIWVMIVTLARVGELSTARKSDIDLSRRTWRIPAATAKNGHERVIHLSSTAVDLLSELIFLSADSEWLMPSRDGTRPLDDKALNRQFRDRQRQSKFKGRSGNSSALALPGGIWTAHDLRRTGSTLMGELGMSEGVIDRCLGHLQKNRLARIYQRHELVAEQIHAFALLGERISLIRLSALSEKVMPIRRLG